jgi:hypothetical protein
MKYIGEYIKPWFDGHTWDHGGFIRCTVTTADDFLECIHYQPFDAIEWDCVHADGDICGFKVAK